LNPSFPQVPYFVFVSAGKQEMTATLLDGKATAQSIQLEIKQEIEAWVHSGGRTPCLAAILVGDDPASQVYVRNKEAACHRVGILSQLYRMDRSSSTAELVELIDRLNADKSVSGILVQLPLPSQVDTQVVLDAVAPEKDVDAFHPHNVGLISQGRPQFLPCTPHGVLQLLKRYGIPVTGKEVCIIGRSDIVGKPLALMLANKDSGLGPQWANATVTVCHSRTVNLEEIVKRADIVIAAIGVPQFITPQMVKPGAIVIDVGINRTAEGLVGDVDFQGLKTISSFITPVPGGVGPLTVTMLLANTLKAAQLQGRLSQPRES
jgi:methylenetetrahydrofolate dehydrogenase (NADP+)/methenyltetrahydrofolate cyclohydrolase